MNFEGCEAIGMSEKRYRVRVDSMRRLNSRIEKGMRT